MGTIQSGQILMKPLPIGSIIKGSITSGRILKGINSYDERIRQGYLTDIEKQKKDYQSEVDKINAINKEIEKQNAELKANYDSIVDKIKDMTIEDYNTYYNTIPDNLRSLFQSPQDIQNDLANQKQKLIEDTLSEIDSRITTYQTKYNYYADLVNKTSDPDLAQRYDDQMVEAEKYLQGLNQAKTYATGDYSEQSVLDYAQELGQNYTYANQESVRQTRLDKLNEAKLIEQYKKEGYTPVYQNQNTNLQELTQFKSIPANKISLGLSQQQVKQEDLQYANQFGQQISYKAPEQKFYLNENKPLTSFNESALSPFFSKSSNSNLENFKVNQSPFKLDMEVVNIPISQQRGTIGSPTTKLLPKYTVPSLSESVIGSLQDLNVFITKGAEEMFNDIGLNTKETKYYNLPYQTGGTSPINPKTLNYELPKLESQKYTYETGFGGASKLIGSAPELALWTFAPEIIAVPYVVRGTEKALNPKLSKQERIVGGIEAGGALAFGFGGEIAKLIPKSVKEYLPYSKVVTETTNLKVPYQEPLIGVSQRNYISQLGGETKYFYDVKTIIPEVAESTGSITKVYRESTLRDLFGMKPKLIYEGNPYVDKLGYSKAIKELKQTGLTEVQAKAKLRLTQPKYIESNIQGEAFTIFKDDMKPTSFLEVNQKVTPKIKVISGVKTRNQESLDYFIKSKGLEVGAKGDNIFIRSLPEYSKTYMKDGAVFSKLKQAGKTTEVFEQLASVKSLGTGELKIPVSDIGYAKTYNPKELELYKIDSLSRKTIPNERNWVYGKSKVISNNIENPIIFDYDLPLKVTEEIETGTAIGVPKSKGLTEQQRLVNSLQFDTKELGIVKEAKSNLIKEQTLVSKKFIQKQIPTKPLEIKQVNIKPIVTKATKELSILNLGGKFQDLTGQGKMESLTGTGKIKELGVFEGRFGGLSLEPSNEKEKGGVKVIDINIVKPNNEYKPKLELPTKEKGSFKFKQPTQPKFKEQIRFKEQEQFKFKQPTNLKQPDLFRPKTNTGIDIITTNEKTPRTPKTPPMFKESKKSNKEFNNALTKAFTILIRSKGKVQEIGKGLPYGKALKLGVEKTKSSLAQTFALRESGTTRLSDINYRVPANLFTQPKRAKTRITPITFVERRGTTLSYYPEVKGLQQSKKNKQRSLKWL